MELVKGIEPSSSACKIDYCTAGMVPPGHTLVWLVSASSIDLTAFKARISAMRVISLERSIGRS